MSVDSPGVGGALSVGRPVMAASTTEQMMAAAGLGGQVVAGQGSEPTVYMGPSFHAATPNAGEATAQNRLEQQAAKQKAFFTLTQAQQQFYNLTPSEFETLKTQGSRMMGYDISNSYQQMQTVWNAMIQAAVARSRITNADVDPWSALDTMAAQSTPKVPTAADYTGPVTSTDLSNPDTARYVLDSALKQNLGRSPNAEEQQSFYAALQQHARSNPTVTTPNEVLGSGATSSGGYQEAQFAQDWAKGQEGAAEYRASQYADLLTQAINNPEL